MEKCTYVCVRVKLGLGLWLGWWISLGMGRFSGWRLAYFIMDVDNIMLSFKRHKRKEL